MTVEVVRQSADGLSDQMWRFSLWTNGGGTVVTLSLSDYQRRTRATKRHKMHVVSRWSRMDRRAYYSDLKADLVPFPDDVVEEARSSVVFVVQGPSPA